LDYNSIIWSPYSSGPIHSLEAIQNRFLRILSNKCNIQRLPHTSYEPLLSYLNMNTLQVRRVKHDICFIYKLLNGYVNCPDLLSDVSFLVPGHTTRQTYTFYVPFQRTLYGKNAPLIRSMQYVNDFNFDMFFCTSIVLFNLYFSNLINYLIVYNNPHLVHICTFFSFLFHIYIVTGLAGLILINK